MFFPPKLSSMFDRLRPSVGKRARRLSHPVIRWIAVVLYSILSIGLPIPVSSSPVSGEVFPCMHHRCGCLTAEKCWRDCCCMTLEQKLAWAEQNGVNPPDYVLAEAKSRQLLDSPPKPKCRCCKGAPVESNCKPSDETGCCSTKTPRTGPTRKPTPADGSVVLLEALKCRGVGENWMGVGLSLPPPQSDWELSLPLAARPIEESVQQPSWAASPSTPPPRLLDS